MADFIDDEASEASSSGSEDVHEPSTSRKAKNKTKSRAIVEDSSEEDEEDEEDPEEMKDLINDEEEEEEDDDDESSSENEIGQKRSHDSDDVSSSLDEEDLDLIQQNLGIRVDKTKKYKRIRKLDDDDSEEDEQDEAKKIHNDLFGQNDLLEDSDDEDVQRNRSRPVEDNLDLAVDSDDEDSDSSGNFIVDDNDEPIPSRRVKKKGARHADSAMQQAQEVFGVDFDFDDIEEDYEEDFHQDAGYEEDYENEDDRPERRRKKTGKKTIYDIYEPAELERSHLTDFDQRIRVKDEPERFQLRSVPVTEADDVEIKEEAEWIFLNAFHQPTLSIQELNHEPIAGMRPEAVKEEIEYALKFMRNEKLEAPHIAGYRREYIPLLCNSFDDTRDLYSIYRHDEQWCKLQSSKKTVAGLYRDMRSYLETKPDDPRIRKIQDSDLERIHNAKTFHDIEDCRLQFKLYYSQLITEMKLYTLEKKIQLQKETRLLQKKKKGNKENGLGEDDTSHPASPDNENEENGVQEDEDDEEPEETEEEKLYKRLAKFKISSSRDFYQAARINYIGDFVKMFGLTPEEFGENLRDDYQKNSVSQHYSRPLDEAAKFIKEGTRFASKEEVLEAAKMMYSREICCDPLVRQTVRKYYFENAVINVKPTPAGMKEIDESHPCYAFKFLKNKPVSRLTGDDLIHLTNAEKEKFIELKFSIEPVVDQKGQISPYHESLKALFYSDFSSIVTKEWNELREEAIKTAMDKGILPCLEKQLRDTLLREAQDKIIKDSSDKLHNLLNVAPFAPNAIFDEYEDFELRNGTRICGFSFDPEGESPCFAAIIDAEGELIDHVRLAHFNIRKRADRMSALERENLAKDRIKLKQFIINRKPHCVALGADTIQTQYICNDIAGVLDQLKANDSLPCIPIEIVDNELPSVVKNLKKSSEEFPEFPPLLLQAISCARKLNDPLSEYVKLCTPDNDILCLRFHSLQDDLPKEDFIESLYQRFITRVNAVGVDPNRVIAHPHTTNLVQFICGLGPRKGAHLLRSIKKSSTGGQLISRQQLVKELGMTSVIFINCSSFIKLDTDTLAEYYPDEHITPLDSTRIHPQSYGWAKKIAVDANTDGEEEGDVSDDAAANAVEAILENPERLYDLDLAAFADQLEKMDNGKRIHTLTTIRDEFHCRYKDYRKPYEPPRQELIFAMLTKETPQTFYNGKLITCRVVQIPRKRATPAQLDVANPVKIDETNLWRCPFCMRGDFQDLSVVWHHFDSDDCPGYAIGVRCKLDNGIFGFVPTKFISDKEIMDPSERVTIGQTIHARVIKIDPDKFSCDLTCRTSDLMDESGKLKPQKDDFYDYDLEKKTKQELEMKNKRSSRRPYCKRVIVHPAFENIDCKTCEKKLQEMEQGHAIIRPSSQGQNFLTLSWKVTDNINQHVTIREEGKENAFSLGHQLFIDSEPYEDLDEIIARYVQPMATYARELLNYKHFIKLQDNLDEMDTMQDTLCQAKKAAACLPYRFCPSRRYPGKFLLGYMPKDKPKIEYLTVTPRGYRFRQLYFKNLNQLIKWFKENWNFTATMMSIHGSVPMSQ